MNSMASNAMILALAAGLLVGCGDDAGNADPCAAPDSGVVVDPICSPRQPDPGQVAAVGTDCCARVDNSASPTDYTLRLSSISISSPTNLASPVVEALLNRFVDVELFNWVFRVTDGGDDGPVTIETGVALRDSSGGRSTYRFYDHATDGSRVVDGAGSVDWESVVVTGEQLGTNVSVDPANVPPSVNIPIFEEERFNTDGMLQVDLALPLQAFHLVSMPSGVDGTCIGFRSGCVEDVCGDQVCTGFDTSSASATTYIGVAESDTEVIGVPPLEGVSLCALISGVLNTAGCTGAATRCCATDDPNAWTGADLQLPDSLCDGLGTCAKDDGSGSTCGGGATLPCNAWQVNATFAAQGIELSAP